MFGGIDFMIDGHMAAGVSGDGGLMIRPFDEPRALQSVAFARAWPPKEKN